MMPQFQSRTQTALGEQRRAHAGAQRERQFHSVALDRAIALHRGIVGDACRLLPELFEFLLQGEAIPSGMQIDGGVDSSSLDDAGKSGGNTVEIA